MRLWKIAGAVSGAVFLVAAAGLAVCWAGSAEEGDRAIRQDEGPVTAAGGKPPPADIQETAVWKL